jgi:hypothetical protein
VGPSPPCRDATPSSAGAARLSAAAPGAASSRASEEVSQDARSHPTGSDAGAPRRPRPTGAALLGGLHCVTTVAAQALAHLDGSPLPPDRPRGAGKALFECGSSVGYDIVGSTQLPYDTFCAECELPIIGDHITLCNGRRYVAGPREGQPCSCRDIRRLHHVRPGDGAAGELQDQRGDRYIELRAGAQLRCDTCEGPIHVSEFYYGRVTSTWIECRRCTYVY